MTVPHPAPSNFPTIAIVGVGLIGGSIAAAVRKRNLGRVFAVGRDAGKLRLALSLGLADHTTTDIAVAAREADVLIFCTPVDRIAAGVREAVASCRPGTVITDAGSTKGSICRSLSKDLAEGVEFLGSHPLAGSEKQGCEHADANLFVGRVCVLTPVESSTLRARERLAAFWTSLGARVLEMSPEAHDLALAETSHLPHLIAATVASTLAPENRELAATGFRDTTRIASGDPDLWTAIFLANADALLESLKKQETVSHAFREAIEERDASRLRELLVHARESREALMPRQN